MDETKAMKDLDKKAQNVQKIIPNLWCDGNVKEVVDYYTAIFPSSNVLSTSYYPMTAEEGLADFQKDLAGKELTIEFELAGHHFTAINAGPEFKPTPAISFMVNFDPSKDDQAREHLDQVWERLIDGGEALMPVDEYPFSKRYGWVKDKYGFSWQLILTNPEGEERPCIIPSLLFGAGVQNRASEAIEYYTSVFKDAKCGTAVPYGQPTGPATAESLMFADFQLMGQWFAAMDSGVTQDTTFNEAISLAVMCKDQEEIDYLWSKLSAVPEAEQCGWCKDKFGVSWQITPENVEELLKKPGAFANMMQMHKLVIADF